jgi:hypothetical protein
LLQERLSPLSVWIRMPKKDPIQHETEYVEFLKRRLESENFKANVSPEEYQETKKKYERAKFKLKMLKQGK